MFHRVKVIRENENVTIDMIVDECNNIIDRYGVLCEKDPAGEEGVDRLTRFRSLKSKFHAMQPMEAVIKLHEFYRDEKKSSRLNVMIENGLLSLLGIPKPVKTTSIYSYSSGYLKATEHMEKIIEGFRTQQQAYQLHR